MRRLSPIDVAFLLLENRHQPLHVGALALFEPPKGAQPEFVAGIAERLKQSNRALAPFDRRALTRFGRYYWEDDPHFDLAHHFVHLSLPQPGRIRELLAMVSRVHSAHLDRAYPLWRLYLIEGLEDGRIATYMKIHHSMVDGVSGMGLMIKSMSEDPAKSLNMPPPWEIDGRGKGKRPARRLGALERLRSSAQSIPKVVGELRQSIRHSRAGHPGLVTSLSAPRCLLNQKVTGSRRFAAQSYSMPRIRAIARKLAGTSNDVVMAMCAGALRAYLLDLSALPDRPLIAGVPVSLHLDRENAEPGNAITFMLANLGTHLSDPLDRFGTIKGSMDYNKSRFESMNQAELMAYALGMLVPGALRMRGNWERMPMNLVISHVPGPRTEMYWQGSKLSGLYPVSLIVDGIALNVTLVSRNDLVDFGLIACRRTLPSVQRLLEHLSDELDALEHAAA